ncbi:MAG: carbohydrate-binding protein [Clostridiales bacterium]|jgi:hypothetical protein|nr:carbohydrate-binding protein [Eubacteriales bacterium]MDH7565349.1 carbohydrate-binding protein [Clostridiales bacterium]
MVSKNQDYLTNGITISPAIPATGDKVKLSYDGLLAKSGATHIFARVGFGSNWDHLYDYSMTRTSTGFEAVIPVSGTGSMNVCFKDCANNWDNNSGRNYSFDISQ